MSLVNDPESLPESVLEELVRSLRTDLEETEELVRSPRGRGPRPGQPPHRRGTDPRGEGGPRSSRTRTRAERGAEANLAYAVMLSVIDLVKSHTDVPKVPPPRKSSGS